MRILVTGGSGFIGSHTCVELLNSGFEIVVIDNLVNSNKEALKRVEKITGKALIFKEVDILDCDKLSSIFEEYEFHAVIHFAGFKSVSESVSQPLKYYYNNVIGTEKLCEVMLKYGVKSIVFSSSATVYGDPKNIPINESHNTHPTNPYGLSKLKAEQFLQSLHRNDPAWKVLILRYFNPIGAHRSGLIGEDPNGIPNNLMPFISQVAVGKHKELKIYGNDYETPDGSGIRDYIHVTDLAKGHVAAVEKIFQSDNNFNSELIVNLGNGEGYSVFEVVNVFEKVNKRRIPFSVVNRRPGDISESFADVKKAKKELNWESEETIESMCQDSWLWQSNFPNGYLSD